MDHTGMALNSLMDLLTPPLLSYRHAALTLLFKSEVALELLFFSCSISCSRAWTLASAVALRLPASWTSALADSPLAICGIACNPDVAICNRNEACDQSHLLLQLIAEESSGSPGN